MSLIAATASTFDIILVIYLIVAGLGFMIWGAEAFKLGWYSDRAWAPMLGIVAFVVGGLGALAMLGL